MSRRFLAAMLASAAAFGLAAYAAEPPIKAPAVKGGQDKGPNRPLTKERTAREQAEAALKQDQPKRQSEDLKQSLLRRAHRLESSPLPADKDKAKALKDALEKASAQGIDSKFTTLVQALKGA